MRVHMLPRNFTRHRAVRPAIVEHIRIDKDTSQSPFASLLILMSTEILVAMFSRVPL